MKPIYKLALLLFFIPFISFGNTGKKKHEKSKTIKKEFAVNTDAILHIKNKFGNIEVTTWNENRIVIDIRITVKGSNLDKIEDKLDNINIQFDASKSLVEAITTINNKKSSWFSWWKKSNNMSYQINYYVKMPITNKVDFNTKYGNIIIDELEGSSKIKCAYGKISIEKLHNKNNTVSLDYCTQSTINYINSGSISIDYSNLFIEKSNTLNTSTNYSNLDIGSTKVINFNSDFGNIIIDEASNINGSSDYTNMRIGSVGKKLAINTNYGGLRIKNLTNNFENITIDGSYADIKIGTNSTNNFDFIIDLEYADFGYPKKNAEIFKSINKTTKKHYEGSFGKGNKKSIIKIKSSYGGVSIRKNNQ